MNPRFSRFKASPQYEFGRKLIHDLTTYPKPVYVLIFGQFLNKFGAFVFPFFTLYLQERDFSKVNISLVLAALSAGGLFAPLVAGYLSDAIGRRNTLVFSLVAGAVTLVGLYFCETLESLLLLSAIHGFCVFLFGAPANALLTDLLPPEKRVTAFALFRLALNLGFAAGPTLAGLLFQKSPFLIFIGDAATSIIFAGMAFFLLPDGLRTIEGKASSMKVVFRSWKEALEDIIKNGPFVQYLFACVLVSICFQQVFKVLSLASTDEGLTPAQFGMVMGFNGLLIAVVELPLCQWLQRMDPRKVILVGHLIFAFGTAGFFLADTLLGYFLAMGLFTIGEIVSFPIGMAYNSVLAPEKFRGRYFGLWGMSWGVAGISGSLGVWFYGNVGAQIWLWAGLVALMSSVLMAVKFRDRRKVLPVESIPLEPALAVSENPVRVTKLPVK